MDAPSPHAQTAAPRFERLTARDWGFLAICAAVFAASLFVALRYFAAAFPEAAIDFRYDRKSSRAIAERLLTEQRLSTAGMKHVAVFDGDQEAKVFLERSVGLKTTNRLARDQVKLWFWHHRWFKPLQEEELAVDVAPTGEIVSFSRHLPEARPLPDVAPHAAQRTAVEFLRRVGVQPGAVNLVARSERRLPKRLQRIFTFESKTIRTADAPYWHTVTLDGPLVTSYSQRLRVPDQWKRSYRELRSKNVLAGRIDAIVLGLTLIAALWVFVVRLRRADVHLRFLLAVGLVSVILVLGVTLNSYPSTLAQYDTTTSFPAFIASIVIFALVQSVGAAIFLMIVCGSGEVLYRERLPHQLAMPRLWTRSALTSRRVFHSFVLGYTLVAFFVAYQVIFYIVAAKFGAWAPAEIPYDDMLNTALPWVAVLFAGFFPSLSEEFLSRAFSIPFLQRFLRSRAFAIVLAGFIWGFGHTTYPNQPFYIRGLEVGLAGVLLGVLMDFTGLLPLLIWHYTVDAFYTAMLLFRSGNPYYIASAGVAAFLFAFPMLVSIVLYLRNGGFAPDEHLTNATLPTSPPPPPQPVIDDADLPERASVSPARLVAAAVAVVLAGVAIAYRPDAPEDAIDFRVTAREAKEAARRHLLSVSKPPARMQVIAGPTEGFRSWNRESQREEGGAPGGFDDIAAEYVARHSSLQTVIDILRSRLPAAAWAVRFFVPERKEEWFVHVDQKSGKVTGYHRYQEQHARGGSLEREAALAVAAGAFARYGVSQSDFDLAEALVFRQPARRDWLFHFDEKAPLAAAARRRVTIRVAGAELTQFATTIRVPEETYREASGQTIVNVVLLVVKLAATVSLLTLIVTGFVLVAFRRSVNWRRAARWTGMLSIIPILSVLSSYESELFRYSTFMKWETFVTDIAVGTVRDVGLRIGLLFLAIAGATAAVPAAARLLGREGRGRLGAAAVVSSLAATALFLLLDVASLWTAHAFPGRSRFPSLSAPDLVALPLPVMLAIGEALYTAIIGGAAVALFFAAFRKPPGRWTLAVLITAILFGVSLDTAAQPHQIGLMLLSSIVTAVVVYTIGRFMMGANPLAYPLVIFTVTLLQRAAAMLQNDRADLQLNGYAAVAVTIITMIWMAWPQTRADAQEIQKSA